MREEPLVVLEDLTATATTAKPSVAAVGERWGEVRSAPTRFGLPADDEQQQLEAEKENAGRPRHANTPQAPPVVVPSGSCPVLPRTSEGDDDGKQGQGEEEEEKDECCICLCEIGEVMGCLTCCEHKFCFDCISQWAEKCNTCPLCKQRFREIIKKSSTAATTTGRSGGRQQQQGTKKQRTERVRVRRKDYNPWSEEDDDDDSEDDELDDEVHWPAYGFTVNSFGRHPPSFHTHYHHPGGLLSFPQPYMHNLHAMGLFDMLSSLVPMGMNGVLSPYSQRSTSTYTSSSSSSGDELGGLDSPEVIIVDSDAEDTLERRRASRAPGSLPPRSSQEIIDLTELPDSENEDNGGSLPREFARRSTADALSHPPPLPTIINLDAAPSPAMHEHHFPLPVRDDEQRRRGGRIADIIHERNA